MRKEKRLLYIGMTLMGTILLILLALQRSSTTFTEQLMLAVIVLSASNLVVLVMLGLLLRQQRLHQEQHAIRLDAFQVTMRTVMDVVNNHLNRLQLLTVHWKHKPGLSPEDARFVKNLTRETAEQLRALSEITSFETHGSGPYEQLNWQQWDQIRYTLVEPSADKQNPGPSPQTENHSGPIESEAVS